MKTIHCLPQKLVVLLVMLSLIPYSRASASHPTESYAPSAHFAANGICPSVNNTPTLTFAYGNVTLGGLPAPVGSVVDARSPRGDIVGCTVVSVTGKYGSMAIYGEDTTITPSVPGMRATEAVNFYVNNNPATPTPALIWSDDKDLHAIPLAATVAPPTANFYGTPVSGVAPLSVNFTDTSSGTVTSWSWIFGDSQTSTQANPSHSYQNPGSYTVSLTVAGPGGSDPETKNAYITVYTGVNAAFSANKTSGTAPLTVIFSNQSTGDWSSLQWNFGDGTPTSSQTNPTHTYATPGKYSVSLLASGLGGSDTETKTDYIVVSYVPPVSNFSANPTSGVAPLAVNFTDTSTGTITSWAWAFGDTQTSTQANPSHTYQNPGSYTVSLTVSGPGGSDPETKNAYITVYTSVNAAFSANKTSGTAPLAVTFSNQSSGDWSSLQWNFGDGTPPSNQTNPTHTYDTPGKYSVSLLASGLGGSDTETKTDYIVVSYAPPAPDFSANLTSGVAPLTVTFTNTTQGTYTTCEWDFGDSTPISSQISPSHQYTSKGTYTVMLTVTGPGGTIAKTKTNYITTYAATKADFSTDKNTGLGPLTVKFTNLSSGDWTNLVWNFGDGTPTSTTPNPTHTFQTSGSYTVTLTASGPGGSHLKTSSIVVIQNHPVFVPVLRR